MMQCLSVIIYVKIHRHCGFAWLKVKTVWELLKCIEQLETKKKIELLSPRFEVTQDSLPLFLWDIMYCYLILLMDNIETGIMYPAGIVT